MERYRSYKDFDRKWGSPVEMREDLDYCLSKLLPKDGMIKSIEDQSTEEGIKFFVELKSKDYLHAYKISDFRSQPEQGWEWYLNKKKRRYEDLKDQLEKDFMSKLEQFLKYFKSYDFYYQYIDNGRQYDRAKNNNKWIQNAYSNLSSSERKQAKKEILKHFKSKELRPEVDRVFN